jgi:hypothetical protein
MGRDGQVAQFHGGVLGQLLGVICGGPALEHKTLRLELYTQAANAIAQATLHERFEAFFHGQRILVNHMQTHSTPVLSQRRVERLRVRAATMTKRKFGKAK